MVDKEIKNFLQTTWNKSKLNNEKISKNVKGGLHKKVKIAHTHLQVNLDMTVVVVVFLGCSDPRNLK